uniref:Putative ovule protein n=1 Tax=Solanum chacoense TaxID=4108 RepID=A0A0V0HC36_SOLCH
MAGVQVSITEQRGLTSMGLRGNDSYKEIIQRNKWNAGEQSLTLAAFSEGEKGPLCRCLVGRFQGCVEIPTRSEVRSWAEKAWIGIHNLKIYDMNGTQFLFEFQSRRDAEHILMGEWGRKNHLLLLEWWTPTVGAFLETNFEWFWVRIIGLSLQLWNDKVMKQIGDLCGDGWNRGRNSTEKPSTMGLNSSVGIE